MARRTGHGVAVLLKIYVHGIGGLADAPDNGSPANKDVVSVMNRSSAEKVPVTMAQFSDTRGCGSVHRQFAVHYREVGGPQARTRILQPCCDRAKLLRREAPSPEQASWVFGSVEPLSATAEY